MYKQTPTSQQHPADSELWERIKKSDRAALADLYDRYVKALYNYASKMCKDKEAVEDAIHDLFVDIWRYRETISSASSVRYYLYLSLRRKVIKSEMKRASLLHDGVKWEEVKSLVLPPAENSLIELEASDERTRRLKKYLNNLSPRQYEAIVLRFYDDFSYEEIASLMNLNAQSARNLVQRGLMHLRQYSQLLISCTVSLLAVMF